MPACPELTIFAAGANGKVGIAQTDRRFHFYAIGRTGTGKSTMLANMIAQDLVAGRGLAVIDPHGDLAQQALSYVPRRRKNDLVYFNPADLDYPIGLNVVEPDPHIERHLVAANLMSVFHKVWKDSWGPRMSYLLHNAILALLENPGSTMLGIVRLLSDERFRSRVVGRVSDPVVRHYWEREFAAIPDRLLPEVISPVQNKVGAYLVNRPLRNILGQSRTTIRFHELIAGQKIFIANLAKGRIGEEAANLIGSLLVTKLQLAAFARANLPEQERTDFYLYVDEFHNFTTESFADILSEARKYHLNLILANQYLEQISAPVRSAVLANAGTLVLFRVGPEDAKILEKELEPHASWLDLVNLSPHEVLYKLMQRGRIQRPYSATTLPAPATQHQGAEIYCQQLIENSRRRYARAREQVEHTIARFFAAS